MAASISFQAAAITSGSSTSRTLSFTVASAAGQERLVALSAIANATPGAVTFTSVAIDGQSATLVGSYARATDGLGNGAVVAFFRAAGTANTSINVTCTISTGAVFDCRGAVWSLNNAGTLLASTTDTAVGIGSIGSLDLNANTITDGAAAAYVLAYSNATRNITWSGLTERLDGSTPLYSGDWHSAADLIVGSTSTPLTITASLPTSFDSNSAVAGVAVSFNPAEASTDTDGGIEGEGQQIIDIGDAINDGTGDPVRVAFDKCNHNFTELYAADTTFLTATAAATTYQPLDGDLTAIAVLTGTNDIYYRSAANTWSPVVVSTGLAFSGGNLTATGGGAITVAVQTFTASGTFTPTASMKYCTIECVGGGGGGGGVGDATGIAWTTGGGGSGGYSRKTVSAATVGASQTVTIGAAGTAGTAAGANGGAGGATSVGTLCVANGGGGGSGHNPASSWPGGAGGVIAGAVGDVIAAGNPGQSGVSQNQGNISPSNGGASYFGGGGRGGQASTGASAVGGAASNYGAGGGAAYGCAVTTTRAGGAGAAGFVIITEYL